MRGRVASGTRYVKKKYLEEEVLCRKERVKESEVFEVRGDRACQMM